MGQFKVNLSQVVLGNFQNFLRRLDTEDDDAVSDSQLPDADYLFYGAGQRARLAKRVREDGNLLVADLGSLYGEMSKELKRYGMRTISTEKEENKCRLIKNGMHDAEIVLCDVFRMPFRGLDASVSYMFLGPFVALQLVEGRKLPEIFEELFKSSKTIYSVEFSDDYLAWFDDSFYTCNPGKIATHLENALPEIEVEYIGGFGKYTTTIKTMYRMGLKFTRKTTCDEKSVCFK